MKIDIEMPLVFRAWPKRAKATKHVYCKETFTAEIAEVSLSDTEVVLEAEQSRRTRAFTLRAHDGALYRRIAGSVAEARDKGLFSDPFSQEDRRDRVVAQEKGWHRSMADHAGSLSAREDGRPVAKPLADQFEWQLARDSADVDLNVNAWPPSRGSCATPVDIARRRRYYTPEGARDKAMDGIHRHRNGVTLDDVFGDLRDVNDLDIAVARELHAERGRALLAVDGELWMRSAPLVQRIDCFVPQRAGERARVMVSMETAPEGYFGEFKVPFYGLDDEDATMADAQRLVGLIERQFRSRMRQDGEREAPEIVLRKPAIHRADTTLLQYDHGRERVRRFGYSAAVECKRQFERWAPMRLKVDAGEASAVDAAYAAAKTSNYVTGVHADMADFILPLASAWKKLGHPQEIVEGYTGVWTIEQELPRVMAALEDIPISLDVPAFSV